ncbi:hypothetical protein HK103_006851 [Boothiomyces macroporosus]|uniref:ABC transporter domain-containing protein n=1 Tax=Boothiomyces macroporosus TaxID=261099 RepID=A0AAD5UG37_9FUNG|nr:hypothetical protein HK103_006851 [Boothiomyces macroporosus]
MISFYTQTAAIIRLNFTRQLVKGKTKYVLVLLFIYGSLSYILLKTLTAVFSVTEFNNIYDTTPIPLYLDTSTLDASAMSKLQPAIDKYNIATTNRTDYIKSTKPDSLLLSFSKFDSANEQYDYTFTYAGSGSFSSLWICISTQNCGFQPDMHSVVFTKYLLDSYLGQDTGAGFQVKEAIDINFKNLLTSSADLFSDFFFFAVSSIMVTNMIEERTKGLKFGLFMTVGVVSAQLRSQMIQNIPAWGIILLCINPRIALSAYSYISGFSPTGRGFTSTSVPFTAPSGNYLLNIVNTLVFTSCCVTVMLYLIGIYLNWLEVSQDETRPLHYPISQFFKKTVPQVAERERLLPKIEKRPSTNETSLNKVQILNLSKIYDGASTKALTEVSLEFSKGEIFGLLGYNGAGKSTLINILCGVLSATDGDVSVFGLDAKEKRYDISEKTGICSQVDILFDELSPKEHMFFFGLMHGVPSNEVNNKINDIVEGLQIPHTMLNMASKLLSGGQKRKLGVALAFINDPELVVLDEMSSGVDPENRRVIWDFLIRKKKDRAILLCTHFMDEADILCDRKAMLTLGQVVCVGSSEFLKNTYNTGYTLSIEKSSPDVRVELFENWFKLKGVDVVCVRSNAQIYEFKISAKDLAILTEFELDRDLNNAITSFSVQENGLEEIFTNKELVDESDITITKEQQKLLLDDMDSFVEPSTWSKTMFFFKFEFKRFTASIVPVILRMSLTLIMTIALYVIFKVFVVNTTTFDKLTFSTLMDRLVPNGFVLETDISDLIAKSPSSFVPLNTTDSITIGRLVKNGSDFVTTVFGGYAGASLLSLNAIFPDKSVSSALEYVSITHGDPKVAWAVIVFHILVYSIFSDFVVTLSDDICDSRERIKFLLLSTGVPLQSYWFVTLVRSLLISLPFNILVSAITPSVYNFSPAVVFFYLLQPIFFSAILGSLLPRTMVRGVSTGIRMFGFLIYIVVVIVGAIKQWGSDQYGIFITLFLYLPTTAPFAVFMAVSTVGESSVPSTASFLAVTIAYLVLYVIILLAIELWHLVIKRIPPITDSFVSFNSVTKRFKKKVAVNNLNLQIEKNEMFAMLGPNGCGKTTSLGMLTAQLLPTTGSIHMDYKHVASEKFNVIKNIGFCPQFDDLLIPNMTVVEHLQLFCSLNGLPDTQLEHYINNLLHAFGIEMFKNVNCGNLSGGTKRKVSSAIAVMLPRSLVVLDEASTGLDPLARQKLWNTVRLLNIKRTTIMTTHYINETSCCDRIAIMTDGVLRVCATEYELTKAHVKGYKATLHLASPVPNIVDFLRSTVFRDDPLAQISVDAVVGENVILDFSQFNTSIGELIRRLTDLKNQSHLKQFTIGRMTLEQVFLDIVKVQLPNNNPLP